MNYQEILTILAPCGLNCYTCFANSRGKIRNHALQLKKTLEILIFMQNDSPDFYLNLKNIRILRRCFNI